MALCHQILNIYILQINIITSIQDYCTSKTCICNSLLSSLNHQRLIVKRRVANASAIGVNYEGILVCR